MIESTQADQTLALARTIADAVAALANCGWAVLDPSLVPENPVALLGRFGRILPQYDGSDTHEVMPRPGFSALPYSQSSNGIGPHTEAPVMATPPRYLALHCHRQARCGGGHTALADGLAFCAALPLHLQRSLRERQIDFHATAPNDESRRMHLRAPILSYPNGSAVLRFSANLFRYGDVNPAGAAVQRSPDAGGSDWLGDLAERADVHFRTHPIRILIPDHAMLIWDNHRLMHARGAFTDVGRHLTRYWLQAGTQGEGEQA